MGLTSDGTGPGGPDVSPWLEEADGAQLPPAASLLLAAELPADARPRQGDRVLLLGIVWDGETLLELQRIAKGGHLKAGALSELPLGQLPPQFRLVGNDGDELVISVPAAFPAEVHESAEKVRSLLQLAEAGLARPVDAPFKGHAYTLELGDRVVVQVAPRLTLIARYVRAARQSGRGFAESIDVSFAAMLMIALLGLGLFVLMLRITPRWDELFGADLARSEARITQYAVNPAPPPPKHFSNVPPTPVPDSARPPGAEGKAGKPEAKQAEAAPSKPGAPVVDREKRERDRKVVADTALVAALNHLKALQQSATSDVFGPGGVSGGINDALGGVKAGGPTGDANGTRGLSTRGNEHGGGGTEGKIGSLGTRGDSGKRGLSLEQTSGGKEETQFIPGKTTVVGGLSRDEINRVIQRHYSEIKYCYEKELARDPALYGKVDVLFQINAGGQVVDALIQQTTMGSDAVEGCIVNHVKRWVFPAAHGGGSTQVSYPYVFKASGQ